ncbi:hypothetical protein TCAL_03995 [Tigriopus californicus]|uniref:Uncharacterized protein n=1 Tax=Tigriopus californicus TaxID=6832 RepID=A0A553NDG1_TIGCA|nr:uncharacterized protein LOC131889065 [Tigriopus californicus]TRY63389.1 hypothetical protein TCAL_03995 [Tigriopus californicus]|eukprot:TCALIF_03995-PA protein Name:"Protein of unknown function" AED:0.16 eAED:0.16 QI:335/1/0.66/1/0.5/0.33/3/0/164
MGSQIPAQRHQKRALKEVISFTMEEELGRDGKTVSTRTIISSRPIIYRIWIKNSTREEFRFRAHGRSHEAFSTSKNSRGFTPVPKGKSWAFTLVQLNQDGQIPHSSLSYIKILSKDGSHFWDITADLEEENAFEIFWNPTLQHFAVRPYYTLTKQYEPTTKTSH